MDTIKGKADKFFASKAKPRHRIQSLAMERDDAVVDDLSPRGSYHLQAQKIGQRTRFSSYDATTVRMFGNRSSLNTRKLRLASWEEPKWGNYFKAEVEKEVLDDITARRRQEDKKPRLGQWQSTALCGNDMLSSVLYVTGMVVSSAGPFAPACLVVVSVMLYLFRGIYAECITALPVNGGSYNVLLNATSKHTAAVAACLTLMSYITTAVLSATGAILYLRTSFTLLEESIDGMWGSVVLLFVAAWLTYMGIGETSNVAMIIFCVHVSVMTVLCIVASVYAAHNPFALRSNIALAFSKEGYSYGALVLDSPSAVMTAMFYGVSTAILGFESSAQFIQEQAVGVFPKTLRNCWYSFSIFNLVICLLAFSVMHLDQIIKNKGTVLAAMAGYVGAWLQMKVMPDTLPHFSCGAILKTVVGLDGFVVLTGAVLSTYVGVTGLLRSMAMDRCIPQMALAKSRRGTNYVLIFTFFALAASQVYLFHMDLDLISDVYTFASLLVLTSLTYGCLVLKIKRPYLPRPYKIGFAPLLIALLMLTWAIFCNVMGKPQGLSYFLLYFMAVGAVVMLMLQKVNLLRMIDALQAMPSCLAKFVEEELDYPVVFFVKYNDMYLINRAILYIKRNEQAKQIIVVHVCEDDQSATVKDLASNVEMIDGIYPRLAINLLLVVVSKAPSAVPVTPTATPLLEVRGGQAKSACNGGGDGGSELEEENLEFEAAVPGGGYPGDGGGGEWISDGGDGNDGMDGSGGGNDDDDGKGGSCGGKNGTTTSVTDKTNGATAVHSSSSHHQLKGKDKVTKQSGAEVHYDHHHHQHHGHHHHKGNSRSGNKVPKNNNVEGHGENNSNGGGGGDSGGSSGGSCSSLSPSIPNNTTRSTAGTTKTNSGGGGGDGSMFDIFTMKSKPKPSLVPSPGRPPPSSRAISLSLSSSSDMRIQRMSSFEKNKKLAPPPSSQSPASSLPSSSSSAVASATTTTAAAVSASSSPSLQISPAAAAIRGRKKDINMTSLLGGSVTSSPLLLPVQQPPLSSSSSVLSTFSADVLTTRPSSSTTAATGARTTSGNKWMDMFDKAFLEKSKKRQEKVQQQQQQQQQKQQAPSPSHNNADDVTAAGSLKAVMSAPASMGTTLAGKDTIATTTSTTTPSVTSSITRLTQSLPSATTATTATSSAAKQKQQQEHQQQQSRRSWRRPRPQRYSLPRASLFTPAVVEMLSRDLNVPTNMMFLCTPDASFPYSIGSFNGVRVIDK